LNDNYDKILDKVLSLLCRFGKEETTIDENTELQTGIGLTSLQVMELVFEVEEEFDISFPLNRLPDIRTVKDLSDAIAATLDQ